MSPGSLIATSQFFCASHQTHFVLHHSGCSTSHAADHIDHKRRRLFWSGVGDLNVSLSSIFVFRDTAHRQECIGGEATAHKYIRFKISPFNKIPNDLLWMFNIYRTLRDQHGNGVVKERDRLRLLSVQIV